MFSSSHRSKPDLQADHLDAWKQRHVVSLSVMKCAEHPHTNRTANMPCMRSGSVVPLDGVPTAFISYSWDSEEHRQWVLPLATRLHENGINVVLDHWYLALGTDKTSLWKRQCRRDHVLLICTTKYKEKADGRSGGVGWETSIVTGELADDLTQTKFIPVLRQGSFQTTFPV
jgi:SEFIR domain